MTQLHKRKTRLEFETTDTIRERGMYRPVIVEATPDYASIRLKGLRHRVNVSWGGLYHFALKCEADRKRAEKRAHRKEK